MLGLQWLVHLFVEFFFEMEIILFHCCPQHVYYFLLAVVTDIEVYFLDTGYYICGFYKNPRSIEALQNAIRRVISSIAVDELQKVSHNLFMRCEACLQAEGGQFQHLL
jgi:hypothetical protein